MSYANNKGTYQTAFVVRCLDNVMSLVSATKISSLPLASVAEQAGLSLTWSETPEDTFCHDEAQFLSNTVNNNLLVVLFCKCICHMMMLTGPCTVNPLYNHSV